jgi:hypothetical protein
MSRSSNDDPSPAQLRAQRTPMFWYASELVFAQVLPNGQKIAQCPVCGRACVVRRRRMTPHDLKKRPQRAQKQPQGPEPCPGNEMLIIFDPDPGKNNCKPGQLGEEATAHRHSAWPGAGPAPAPVAYQRRNRPPRPAQTGGWPGADAQAGNMALREPPQG